ncbi:MAG: imidazolonepropionase [Deltaproteobacteria bacterium]|jgi:imidazolonepropionase|nr:imidazolonepropionase [Deltaproteobacteria bacterium]
MKPAKNVIPEKVDALWLNVHLATMTAGDPYGMVKDGAIAVAGNKIALVGKRADLPVDFESRVGNVHDGGNGWITPGLVDCHTHLVYAGSRAREFELRLLGVTYEEIARQGGGIRSTVAATREADEQVLLKQSASRLKALMREGVTTVEIKSGYGLDLETELRMLRVARQLGEKYPVSIVPTYLGAHALPPEFEGRSDDYIDFVCDTVMPEVAAQKLAVAVDAFCENIAFTPAQTERVFKTAQKLALTVKLHAEQLSDLNGAALAARFGALSADHLEYASEQGIQAMSASGTVAVLLPGAFYFLREKKRPPVDLLRRYNVPMALSTDCNPGSSPTTSLLLILNMACTLFHMTPEEALAGITRNGARALGRQDRIGTLESGKDADFVLWDIDEPAELAYRIGFNPLKQVVHQGRVVSRLT